MDVSEIQCVDHFGIYINIKSLRYILEINVICPLYLNLKKEKKHRIFKYQCK